MKNFITLIYLIIFMPSLVFAQNNDEWLANEILTQLSDLRRDINGMRQQVEALQLRIENLEKSNAPVKKALGLSSFDMESTNVIGDKDARYVMVEFTDFECPFCGRHTRSTFNQIKERYVDTGKIQYAIRDYPLGFHRKAKAAAVTALCAGDQGKYWEMYKALFSNQASLNSETYQALARELSLDMDVFQNCQNDAAKLQKVESDVALGNKIGISGTPAFVLGELKDGKVTKIKLLTGAQPIGSFIRFIDSMVN